MANGLQPVLPKIKISVSNLTPTLRRIAAFVTDAPEETTRLSVEELAARTGVSVASIYRFCREMNYQTFSQLKLAIAREITSEPSRHGGDDGPEMHEPFVAEYVRCLDETGRFVDDQTLRSVIDLILRSTRIMTVGVGASGIAANFLHYKLLRAGIACHRPLDMHLATMLVSSFTNRDLLVVFSASGATRDIVDLCTLADNGAVPIVSVTSRPRNPVADRSIHHMIAVSSDSPVTSGSGASVISQVAVADIVYHAMYERDDIVRRRVDQTTDSVIAKHL
ncbi:MurR/RpiR family transcriptional regulator [Pararhizobium mangrovi]|uniref:MurR/RpiR family transcriptional regulator n=1 Tax=Pararhizobium mangrovi TaxID=2590452 RepID=A0A506U264_9HYPH|nr:MurR/RpiR family transcriptional regulator [Pararhizobium mangrovi]TPW27558.1 MurR/RpiR family transcriptional regulator [Pararhizobium mangrovi]